MALKYFLNIHTYSPRGKNQLVGAVTQRCDDASFVVGWRNVGSHLGLTWSLHESTCLSTSGRFDEGEGEDDGLKVSVVAYLSLNPSDYICTCHLQLFCRSFQVNTETET